MGRFLVKALVLVAFVGAAVAAGGWWYLDRFLNTPSSQAEERVVMLEPGTGVAQIAQKLADAGIIEDPLLFRVGARLLQRDRRLKAGEMVFPASLTPLQVFDILEEGKAVQYRIVVPEGLTSFEVMEIVAKDETLEGEMPDGIPAEGTLLPETYFYSRGETRAAVVERMKEAMQEALDEAWTGRADNLPIETPEEALVLASIIEKETSIPEEYGVVASVFVNRLNKGMMLQTDPTVIYALTEGKGPLGRRLLRKDLEVDSPYNTYRIAGLPPGPIANPGRAAIHAAVNPDDTPYIYFVADGTGGHAFAKTLDEHNRNAAEWRRIRDQAKD
ncbi:MAG: endolytic transglycosylase MltG [Geminicoccaceae bacterium]